MRVHQGDGSAQDMAELAQVARPVERRHGRHHVGRDAQSCIGCQILQDALRQCCKVIAFTQGRQLHLQSVDAVVQVAAELALFQQLHANFDA